MTIASVLSHLVVRPRLFYKINENKSKRKINIDLAVVASRIPGGTIHDSRRHGAVKHKKPKMVDGSKENG